MRMRSVDQDIDIFVDDESSSDFTGIRSRDAPGGDGWLTHS
jgi:hypothetical protein